MEGYGSMKHTTDMNKNEALNVLGLEVGASKETIISKSEELSEELKSSENPEDHAKLAKVYVAVKVLLEEESRYLNSRRLKRKRLKTGIISGALLILIILVSVFSIVSINRGNTYSDLQTMMQEVSIANYEAIGNTLNDLPDTYEDVATIKDQYTSIKNNMKVIEDNNMFEESESMREAYYELEVIDEETEQWDLSYYLGRINKRILLLGVEYETDDYYFKLAKMPDTERGIHLYNDLPNAKNPEEDYRFYTQDNMTIIGFVNRQDGTKKFKAYEILSIDEDALRIYAFTTDETYTLYSTGS